MPADPDGDGNPGLAPGGEYEVTIVYAPVVDGPDAGQIIIVSNDPALPEFTVDVSANSAAPCLRVTPEALDFGAALMGRSTARSVRLESCGGSPLEVTSVRMRDDSAPAFAVAPDGLALPVMLPAVQPGEAPAFADVRITFAPDDPAAQTGTLLIENNDPLRPIIEVPITGRGSDNACPVPDAGEDAVQVEPNDIVMLDGSASTDPDGPGGRPVEYEWIVVQSPDGSTSTPVERFEDPGRPADSGIRDDLSTPTALFLADVAGVYVLELRVTDNLDLSAPSDQCPQPIARLQIEALPDVDVHVQLTWDTPGDPNQTDGDGTDLDLHLRHPQGEGWDEAPFDCYYANSRPDWGPAGAAGDPALVLEDINGAGPEIITLNEPEDTAMFDGSLYRIGVRYYRAENFADGRSWGPSEATVRVLLRGLPVAEFVRVMDDTGDTWEVADIVWSGDDRRVVEVNAYIPAP